MGEYIICPNCKEWRSLELREIVRTFSDDFLCTSCGAVFDEEHNILDIVGEDSDVLQYLQK